MGSEFPETQAGLPFPETRKPIRVSVPGNIHLYQDLVFEKRAHTVLQREKTHVVLSSQERERV
jgi:hypothetical protein